jgi:hypothetical protein
MPRQRIVPLPASPGLPAHKLNVLVGLDSELTSARIGVRGAVTANNLGALYAVVRRTNSFLPGMDIVLDLSGTTTEAVVLEGIRASVRTGMLLPASDPAGAPCRLRIIDPVPARELVAA